MQAAITFFASLVLLAAFLVFRNWEQKRGVKMWAHSREAADAAVSHAYRQAVLGDIPSHFRVAFLALIHRASHMIVVFTVRALRAIERPLARLSYEMRRGAPASSGKEPSAFLKTIKPEKKPEDGV